MLVFEYSKYVNKYWITISTNPILYETICRPIMLCSLENQGLGKTESKAVKTHEGNATKRMAGLSKRIRTIPILHALRIEPIEPSIQRLESNFYSRLLKNKYTANLFRRALTTQELSKGSQTPSISYLPILSKRFSYGRTHPKVNREIWLYLSTNLSFKEISSTKLTSIH